MNEPALITSQQGATIPGVVRHSCEGNPSTHREIHNVYGMQMVRASTDGISRLRPERRSYLITRSGWAGVQRYANHWTGDNKSTWDHLRLSIQMVLTLGLSGIPITGPDIGGLRAPIARAVCTVDAVGHSCRSSACIR
jgi:alpha-glucosidase